MKQRRLHRHKTCPIHCDSDMVALEDIENSGGNTGELGNNHEMNPPNRQRHIVQLLVIDVHVNIKLIPIELVADLPH